MKTMTEQELRDGYWDTWKKYDAQASIAGRWSGSPEGRAARDEQHQLEVKAGHIKRELISRGVDLHKESADSWKAFTARIKAGK